MELSDYTADRPGNCQLVVFADRPSGEEGCFCQLLSQHVHLYADVKGSEASRLHVVLHRSYQLHPISPSGEINPQVPAEGVCDAAQPLTGHRLHRWTVVGVNIVNIYLCKVGDLM